MELGNDVILLLSALVGMLVAEGLQSLSRLLGRDFSGHYAGITAALVGLLVAVANGALALVPPEYIPFVQGALAFIVIVFGPAGIHSILKKARTAEIV